MEIIIGLVYLPAKYLKMKSEFEMFSQIFFENGDVSYRIPFNLHLLNTLIFGKKLYLLLIISQKKTVKNL